MRDIPGLVCARNARGAERHARPKSPPVWRRREPGRTVEVLLLARRESVDSGRRWWAGQGRLRPEAPCAFRRASPGTIESADDDVRLIRFDPPMDDPWLERNGHVPLPPYIRRAGHTGGRGTVPDRLLAGSSAQPPPRPRGCTSPRGCWRSLRRAGHGIAWVTLHVGLGTFLPIRSEQIEDHRMHEEEYSVPERNGRPGDAARCATVGRFWPWARRWCGHWRQRGQEDGLAAGEGRTRIYITPGFTFRVVTQLFTNFHTPESSLLVLVSAFAGRELILRTYKEAIQKRYRFFSYGDAMLIK